MTHSGTWKSSAGRWPVVISASAMMPIVFCASLAPWVNATNPPEISCRRRNARFTVPGERRPTSQSMRIITPAAPSAPATGATSEGISTFSVIPPHCTASVPDAMRAAPPMPPTSAWLELDGRPTNQVSRFHVIAPTRPARMMSSVIASATTMPVATVAATLMEANAPAKFSTAAVRTPMRGEIARVDTDVAIEFAVSWKPFVKSKNRATTTSATSANSIRRS
jgi:hypothetical protein